MLFKHAPAQCDALRQAMSVAYLADETQCINEYLSHLDQSVEQQLRISKRAFRLVDAIRQKQSSVDTLNALLQEYDLSSQEGVMLLCLAEALLRIPDAATVDYLIRDKLAKAHWDEHLGHSQSVLVNASTWGLLLTGRIVQLDAEARRQPVSLLQRLLTRISEPVLRNALREATRLMGHQFVMGRSIDEAMKRSQQKQNTSNRYSYDMLGEAVLSQSDAESYYQRYQNAIKQLAQHSRLQADVTANPGISIKLSALHPRFEVFQYERVMSELLPRVLALVQMACTANIGITIDSEETERLDLTLDIFEQVFCHQSLSHWSGLGLAVQAYQKRAVLVIDWLATLAQQQGRKIMLRLVKGAYWDTEIKRAQEQGLMGYPVFTRKLHTDICYLYCAKKILEYGDCFYPQFATHNAQTLAAVLEYAGNRTDFETQRLHGMGEALYDALLQHHTLDCRVYAPVGRHKDLLPYLVRRLLENGANTSFINRVSDARAPIDEVIADPLQQIRESDITPHPAICLPRDIYGQDRVNAEGYNLFDIQFLQQLAADINPYAESQWHATILGADVDTTVVDSATQGRSRTIVNPANQLDRVGVCIEVSSESVVKHSAQMIADSQQAFLSWQATTVEERAGCLELMAEQLQQHAPELIALIVREGGRTVIDAHAEIREAVDYCRYYAMLGRQIFAQPTLLPGPVGESNALSLHGRGVFLCISPWNFPLAIFCGQIAAALVAGNTVIAKPASLASLTAHRAVQLFYQAGVPPRVLQLLLCGGDLLAEHVINNELIAGIAFTGSSQSARSINLRIAQRKSAIIPFIAETGGQNAMIVDSSALPEQLVIDVIKSAFNSAGQRCSALRLLFLQDEIAERVIELLCGAMQELTIGEPQYLSTDVGPVIDAHAATTLRQYIERMTKQARLIYQCPLTKEHDQGHYIAPVVFEIDHVQQLDGEVFGPVLHIIRYQAQQLDDVIEAINGTHYGLTLGIHTRIETKADYIFKRVRVGNVYLNRNMIGAAVGVQPFGGEGLSGTGPKAGGPHYLYRFATERVFTNNITAVGGNATLLSLSLDGE